MNVPQWVAPLLGVLVGNDDAAAGGVTSPTGIGPGYPPAAANKW